MICGSLQPPDLFMKHLDICKANNPDRIPPFVCSAAAGHLFYHADELHLHEMVCPVVYERNEMLYGPELHVISGNIRAPTPTNLEPEEVWEDEDLIEVDRPFESPPKPDDAYNTFTERLIHVLSTEFPPNCSLPGYVLQCANSVAHCIFSR